MQRFSKYWDMFYNSGRFKSTIDLLFQINPFERFSQISEWLYRQTKQTHAFAMHRFYDLIHVAITELFPTHRDEAEHHLIQDYNNSQLKQRPKFTLTPTKSKKIVADTTNFAQRQKRHLG